MNARIRQLRDLVVALDRADRNLDAPRPQAYREAASRALALTKAEMGLLPMADFSGPVNALQTLAENIFFIHNGSFADLDGTGRAAAALTATTALLRRLRSPAAGAIEISEGLLARLQAVPTPVQRNRA